MAKSLDAELAAIAADERKLAERRQAHQAKVREAAHGGSLSRFEADGHGDGRMGLLPYAAILF
jgi:hypothetical protein